jgi:hypothetical protein
MSDIYAHKILSHLEATNAAGLLEEVVRLLKEAAVDRRLAMERTERSIELQEEAMAIMRAAFSTSSAPYPKPAETGPQPRPAGTD